MAADLNRTIAPKDMFEELVVPEIEVLMRVARSLSEGQYEADDLVQETLLRAYRSIGSFDGAHVRAWLFTIMRNANMNRRRRKLPSLLGNAGLESFAEKSKGPEELTMDASTDGSVLRAVAQLSPKLLAVITLVDVDQLSYEEAALILEVPIGTVMSRLHRSRRRVRAMLQAGHLEGKADR